MTDSELFSDDEIVSAYLDGEATPEERARVENDPRLQQRLAEFRRVAGAGWLPSVAEWAGSRVRGRRAFLSWPLSLAFVPLVAEAQAPGKVWHVAVLTGAVPRSVAPVRALEQRLAELGYVEGRNLVIDFRSPSSTSPPGGDCLPCIRSAKWWMRVD